MNPRSQPRSLRARLSGLLLLSLASCGGSGGDAEVKTGAEGETRPGTVSAFPSQAGETATREGRSLSFCRSSDPDPVAIDDETSTCLRVLLDGSVLGTGPATLAIDGTLRWDPLAAPSARLTFTPGPGHSPAVEQASVLMWCGEGNDAPATEQLQGQVVLTENSSTRLAGHVTVDVSGRLAGNCWTEGARFDLGFGFPP